MDETDVRALLDIVEPGSATLDGWAANEPLHHAVLLLSLVTRSRKGEQARRADVWLRLVQPFPADDAESGKEQFLDVTPYRHCR